MYAGEIVEQADVRPLFRDPKHPYTRGLIGSIPTLGVVKEELETIPGVVPSLMDLPPGCRFASRCKARIEHGLEICLEVRPELRPVTDGHLVRCWIYHNEDGSLKTTAELVPPLEEGPIEGGARTPAAGEVPTRIALVSDVPEPRT
jgi:oligopeptide/dipeptide ABC transporter ATP-binding protein